MSSTFALLNQGTSITLEIAEILEEHFSAECEISKANLKKKDMSYSSLIKCGESETKVEVKSENQDDEEDVFGMNIKVCVEDPEDSRHEFLVDSISELDGFDPEVSEIEIDNN